VLASRPGTPTMAGGRRSRVGGIPQPAPNRLRRIGRGVRPPAAGSEEVPGSVPAEDREATVGSTDPVADLVIHLPLSRGRGGERLAGHHHVRPAGGRRRPAGPAPAAPAPGRLPADDPVMSPQPPPRSHRRRGRAAPETPAAPARPPRGRRLTCPPGRARLGPRPAARPSPPVDADPCPAARPPGRRATRPRRRPTRPGGGPAPQAKTHPPGRRPSAPGEDPPARAEARRPRRRRTPLGHRRTAPGGRRTAPPGGRRTAPRATPDCRGEG
jgi:hypothetical protein